MKEVKTGWKAMMAFAVVSVMVFMSYVPVCYGYSSEVEAEGSITVCWTGVFDDQSLEKFHSSSIVNRSVSGSKSTTSSVTTYTYGGDVSSGLYLHIQGEGSYAIQAQLSNATSGIDYTFTFGTSDSFVLNSGSWTGKTSGTYASGTYVAFKISIDARSMSSTDATLGDVTFVLIKDDASGPSTKYCSNPVTVSVRDAITSDSDVKKALDEVNETEAGGEGVTGSVTKKGSSATDTTFKFVEGKESGHHSIYITATSDSSSPDVVDTNSSFSFDLNIPAEQKFCIKIQVSTAVRAENSIEITADGISGSITLNSSTFRSSTVYAWVTASGTDYSFAQSTSSSMMGTYPGVLTLHFEGERTAGWIYNGTLKIQILME